MQKYLSYNFHKWKKSIIFEDQLSTREMTNIRAVQLIKANRCCAPAYHRDF